MNTEKLFLWSSSAAISLAIQTRAVQLGPSTICAGTAGLDNGSVITLGQSFVGMMRAADEGVSLALGILPVFESERHLRPNINPTLGMMGGLFTFSFQTHSGRNYIVEASSNLSDWAPVWTNVGNGNVWQFTDLETREYPQRFYRIVTP